MPRKRILLVGGGHAHLAMIRRRRQWKHEVLLLSPDTHWYSGRITQVLAGLSEPVESTLDVADQCHQHGVGYRQGEIARLLPEKRLVELTTGGRLAYDVLSLNLGSETATSDDLKPDGRRVFSTKPLSQFGELRQRIKRFATGGRTAHVAIVGSGASAIECAFALTVLGRGSPVDVTLIHRPGDWRDGSVGGELKGRLEQAGVTLHEGEVIQSERQGDSILLKTTEPVVPKLPTRIDFVLLATGLRPPAIVAGLGLPTDDAGRIRCDRHLRVVGRDDIFAAGDCMTFEPSPQPANGVVAVRQGQLLAKNLPAAADGGPLHDFKPQRRYLQLLLTGRRSAHLRYGGLHSTGPWWLWLKRRLDSDWLRG